MTRPNEKASSYQFAAAVLVEATELETVVKLALEVVELITVPTLEVVELVTGDEIVVGFDRADEIVVVVVPVAVVV